MPSTGYAIKNAWELTATGAEAEALAEMLDTCEPSRSLSVVRVESSQPDAAAVAHGNTGHRQDLRFV